MLGAHLTVGYKVHLLSAFVVPSTLHVLESMAEVPEAVASSSTQSVLSKRTKSKRNSYSREDRLKCVNFYFRNSKNKYRTCKMFNLNSRTFNRWISDEDKIRCSKKGSKRSKFERSSQYPEMEEQLHDEYKDLRRKGLKVGQTVCKI